LKGGDKLEEQNKKLGQFKMSLNSLEIVPNDPTILRSDIVIFDFEKSGNNQIITKEVALDNMKFLIGKRLCCKYINKEDNGGELDALGTHEQYETTNRSGEDVIYTDTEGIGFIEDVYIGTYIDDNGIEKEAVIGKCILWSDDHYLDIIELLKTWLMNNIKIHFSVEYYYFNYSIKDGVEYIQSPILFNALTALNSEDRGDAIEVLPSYDCATLTSFNELNDQWNKAINSLQSSENLGSNKLKQNSNQKEEIKTMENIFLNAMKANNQLSFGDIRDKIYESLASVMMADEYNNLWIGMYDVYEDFFIYDTKEGDQYVNYKVAYSKADDDTITVSLDSKEKVEFQRAYVSVNELQELENSKNALVELQESKNALETATSKIEELNGEIKSLNEKVVEKSNNSKVDSEKFNELTDKLVSLNSMVAEMQPIVEKYNAEVFEKSLNEATESYRVKFTSVNALDVFDEDSTQELIKESINSVKEKADKAKYSLNALIVESIKPVEKEIDTDDIMLNVPKISINQVVKLEDTKDLTDVEDDVLSKYGLKY
jgi:hypothetical protein